MKISVLMNTYNRAHLLRLALTSYLVQSAEGFELVIADDGSTDETPDLVEDFRGRAPFEVRYVRQEHEGHRRAAILNRGIESCTGDWILFTDCDSLAFPDLVESHREHARPDRLLCGGYFRLDEEETRRLTPDAITGREYLRLFTLRRRIEVLRKHLKARWQILRRRQRRPHNMGLNYSVSKKSLYDINGYDENFTGWGSADGDVRNRLRRVGVRPHSLYASALVAHMWHPVEITKSRENLKRNRAYAARKDAPVFCDSGLRR